MPIDDIYEVYDSTERKWLIDNCSRVRGLMRETQQPVELPTEERIAYHERSFDEMRDIFLLESLRCAGLNNCEPALWMGICRSAMKRLSSLCLPKRESVDLGKCAEAVRQVFDLSLAGPDSGFRAEDVVEAVLKASGIQWRRP